MTVLEPAKPWTGKVTCANCSAVLLLNEEDVRAIIVNNLYYAMESDCPECKNKFNVRVSDVPIPLYHRRIEVYENSLPKRLSFIERLKVFFGFNPLCQCSECNGE